MGRPKKDTRMVKFAISNEAYGMFANLAKAMGLDDVQSAIRICSMLQLTQFQTTHMFPQLGESSEESQDRAMVLAASLIPEVREGLEGMMGQPEKVEPEKPFGFGSRADVDGQGVELVEIGQPLAISGPGWSTPWLNL